MVCVCVCVFCLDLNYRCRDFKTCLGQVRGMEAMRSITYVACDAGSTPRTEDACEWIPK